MASVWKFGHIKGKCRELTENKEKGDKQKKRRHHKPNKSTNRSPTSSRSDSESAELVVTHALSANHRNTWIIDSGDTCHVS